MNPIVGIGELLWDIFPDGRKVAGGAPFNFAFHCRQLGHDAVIVSRVGNDDLGRELRAEVRRLGLSDEFIQTDPDHPTGTVRVTVDDGGQPSYTITEEVAWDYIEWNEQVEELAVETPAVCFGTLAQRSSTAKTTVQNFLREHGNRQADGRPLRVFDVNIRRQFDAKVFQWCSFLAEWIKLNSDESRRIHDVFRKAEGDYSTFLRKLLPVDDELQRRVIITEGAEGCLIFAHGHEVREPGVPARIVDTVGAGDSFTAAMVCLHLEGRPLRECARFANHYAARVCEHQGATPRIDRAEVERAAGG